jgi:squalene-hopene/tetraprenyl-beta-curcumene cyclase
MARRWTKAHGALALALIGGGAVAFAIASRGNASEAVSAKTGAGDRLALEAVEAPSCEGDVAAGQAPAKPGHPGARAAAQKGLDYLAGAAAAWQTQNNCYGCHVQAVTIEAFAVGRRNQYDIGKEPFDNVLRGILELPGGARHASGLGYTHPGPIYDTGKIFGAAALARYDELASRDLESVLLAEAGKLIEQQQQGGQLSTSYQAPPVAIQGDIQTTALAVVAWKQAYERSADERWLSAIANAERYLSQTVAIWEQSPPDDIQAINYAVIGLLAAGVGADEAVMTRLAAELRHRQLQDGGWGLGASGESAALATGQTLYVLRLLGMTDGETAIDRGQAWIIEHQRNDGSWSEGGFGKAEAMWSVLGLVSVDVLTVSVAGLVNGQRAGEARTVVASARDNEEGGGVVKVELFVDDVRVAAACGAELRYPLDGSKLSGGAHMVDVQATNRSGKVSRRRFEVFADDVYLTQTGSHFVAGTTEISARDIAPAADRHQLELEIFAADANGSATGPRLHRAERAGAQGSIQFAWSGEQTGAGQYVARLSVRDASGELRQKEEIAFVHDTLEAQQARFSHIQGDLSLASPAAAGVAANAEVELLDQDGNVVSRTRSTRTGKYRFKNVAPGKDYQVRVNKKGWAAPLAKVRAEKGAESQADLKVKMK